MTYRVSLCRLGKEIEEEVELIFFESVSLVCFTNFCPFSIEVGQKYRVELIPFIFDRPHIDWHLDEEDEAIERIGESFAYYITGTIWANSLTSCGIVFENVLDGELPHSYEGKLRVLIDRLDVNFISAEVNND